MADFVIEHSSRSISSEECLKKEALETEEKMSETNKVVKFFNIFEYF